MVLSDLKKLLPVICAALILSACGGLSENESEKTTASLKQLDATAAEAIETWIFCAREDETCSFTGTAQVRYGLNDTYAYKTATGSIGCNNQVFGDPLFGADKICEYLPVKISKYLSLSDAKITKYKDNKQGAATYTFDDSPPSSFTIASIFESFGLRASFYVIPSTVTDWLPWKGLAEKGHEIGNHSMTHLYLTDWYGLSDADLDFEINQSQRLIEEKVGVRPLTFVFPHNQSSERTLSMVMQNHVATRIPGFNYDSAYRGIDIVSASTADYANWKLWDTLSIGGWFYMAGHGIDGDGYEPVTSQYLRDHLTYASSLSSTLWIDTFLNVARYRLCRDQITPEVTITTLKNKSG